MRAELTFEPGRVPGLSRTPRHKAAPTVSPGLNPNQRAALRALIHVPARRTTWQSRVADAVAGIAWMVVTACALAWTLVIAIELAPDLRLARSFDRPHLVHIAMPHVVENGQADA